MTYAQILKEMVDHQTIAEALEDAILYCDYWGLLPRDENGHVYSSPSAVAVVDRGETILLNEFDEEDMSITDTHEVTLDKFAQGVIKLALERFFEEYDSPSVDAALQYGLFSEIRYS